MKNRIRGQIGESSIASAALAMGPGSLVTVTKLAACTNPVTKSGNWNEWTLGQSNPLSLPIDYTMLGYLMERVEVGGRVRLFRVYRNGVISIGKFFSTPIVAIHADGLVETFNSIYRIELYL